jgi:phosphoribosylamine--glycine ligase
LFCADGNAGIAEIADRVPIKPQDIAALADFAGNEAIDLTFVGGEVPLALGIADEFTDRGMQIVGVSRLAARLESSKAFAKEFMLRHSIPTAAFRTADSPAGAKNILGSSIFGDESSPVVVKADGLAAGKGVVVAADRSAAIEAIGGLDQLAGHDAASRIVLEECLVGREVSLLLFCDGENFALMPPTRDHKRIGEGDTGPNTGGMGTITDASLLNDEDTDEIIRTIIRPTIEGCRSEGSPFRGIMFLGLMMTAEGPKLLEYNVRFGDPETQAILVRLESDLTEICDNLLSGDLDRYPVRWRKGSSACVVLASEGYPGKARTGDTIEGVDAASAVSDVSVFHAGTARNPSGELITAGGRVLGVTALGRDLNEAIERAYQAASKISWNGMQFRRDIGR